jgi:molecular chaperone IbpA
MALSGFNKNNIEVEMADGELTVKSKNLDDSKLNKNFIHKGISERSFIRKFTLSDEIQVKTAEMNDGMLSIELEKIIPDHKKPKLILIK